MYNLNEKRISPAALLQPNELLTRTHRKAQSAAILREARLQMSFTANGRPEARLVAA